MNVSVVKVFRVVEVDGYGEGNEVKHVAAYSTRKLAEDFLRNAKNNTYLSLKEDLGLIVGDKCFLLKREQPVILLT